MQRNGDHGVKRPSRGTEGRAPYSVRDKTVREIYGMFADGFKMVQNIQEFLKLMHEGENGGCRKNQRYSMESLV